MIITLLKKIYKRINGNAVHGSETERMPFADQMAFLRQFPEPKDDYERSYFKFRCFCAYCYYQRKWLLAIYNIGAMLLLPFVFLKLKKARGEGKLVEKVDAVVENVLRLPNSDFLPEEVLEKYPKIREIETVDYTDSLLSEAAEEIYRKLRKKYFFHFYFRMIVLQKLGMFSGYLERWQPKAVAFYSCEREFSGPLQALLCEKSGAEYLAFMHGDYLSTLSFAFQRYSRYYVWDPAYIEMFNALRCASPMTVYRPKKLSGIAEAKEDTRCGYFATYYFSDETQAEAEIIYEIFSRFEAFGLRTKIRPHPRFSDLEMLREVFHEIKIEDPKSCSLAESITDSLYIVGLNTTVLSEAYFSGKTVVIDDCSDRDKYLQLDERGYVMIKRPHILLSVLSETKYKEFDNHYAFFK